MRRPGQVSGFVTPGLSAETIGRLVENPLVATVMSKQLAVDGFRSFQDQMMGTVYTAVAMSVLTALVVIWSSLAVTLLEREPEFATMRARGFGRRELTAVVSTEVIAQLAIGLVLAIPVALGIVFPLTQQLAQALQTSLEPFISPQDYLFGMLPALILMPVVVQWGIRRLMSLNIGLTVKRSISV
jgi:ABC-type antimicrobial peptide transport system permease subunit